MKNPFIHMVFFWLKEPDNQEHRATFEASIKRFLTDSAYAGSWHVGTPAGSDRPVVDSSYTYCLMVTFASREMHDQYQSEPPHLRFIAECSNLWERVQVYDSVTRDW
jgi:hypothetical protein